MWVARLFPAFKVFAPRHERFWQWLWEIEQGKRPSAFVGIWSRGGGKSSSVEAGTIALGATGRRRYGLYISGTQEQAEKHLESVAIALESDEVAKYYPEMADRDVNKYGSSRGWRRNRLTTSSGFVIDAVGLRTGTRGVKFEQQRPDFMILDDVDELDDDEAMTQKKIDTLTKTLLPAGSNDLAVIAIQNLIIPDGIFARFDAAHPKPAGFLRDRIVSGPEPAVFNLEYEERETENGGRRLFIVGGEPSWLGQDINTCVEQMNEWDIDAFLAEAQHEPRARGEKIYRPEWWQGRNRYSVHDQRLLSLTATRVMSWDTAESAGSGSAYSACVVGDFVPYRGSYALLVRDAWRGRVEFADLTEAIADMGRKWGFDNPSPRYPMACIIEDASSGRQLMQAARSNVATLRLTGVPWMQEQGMLQPFRPKTSKDRRAVEAARFCRAGRVLLPEPDESNASWLMTLEKELYDVPQTIFRDLSDAWAQLILQYQAWMAEPGQQYESEAA